MRGAGWISELVDRVGVGEPAQAGELADALASVELQFGRPMGEQEAPQLALAEQVIELGRRHIDQEQDQYPKLDRGEAMPGEGRHHVRQEVSRWVVLDEPEPHEMLEQASDEHNGPVYER